MREFSTTEPGLPSTEVGSGESRPAYTGLRPGHTEFRPGIGCGRSVGLFALVGLGLLGLTRSLVTWRVYQQGQGLFQRADDLLSEGPRISLPHRAGFDMSVEGRRRRGRE
jgi:hypothetical protein